MSPEQSFAMITTSLKFDHIRRRTIDSQRTTPIAKMSVRRSKFWPPTCSGDMYAIFPFSVPTEVCTEESLVLTIPKSRSFTSPS